MMFPCEWCGWMPQDCPCKANKTSAAVVKRRHKQAVKLAQTPPRRRLTAAAQPVVLSPWMRGSWGQSVAHRFRDDDGRSACGLTGMSGHGEVRAATAFDGRCAKCVRSITAAADRMAVAA